VDAVEEPFVRGSVADFLEAAGADAASQLEICIERMHALHSACQPADKKVDVFEAHVAVNLS
jgi:hypothetical protein